MIDEIDRTFAILEDILSESRKRHLAGGFLVSLSLFFAGLAVTIITIDR